MKGKKKVLTWWVVVCIALNLEKISKHLLKLKELGLTAMETLSALVCYIVNLFMRGWGAFDIALNILVVILAINLVHHGANAKCATAS